MLGYLSATHSRLTPTLAIHRFYTLAQTGELAMAKIIPDRQNRIICPFSIIFCVEAPHGRQPSPAGTGATVGRSCRGCSQPKCVMTQLNGQQSYDRGICCANDLSQVCCSAERKVPPPTFSYRKLSDSHQMRPARILNAGADAIDIIKALFLWIYKLKVTQKIGQ
jgi:hypothetical protein